MASIADFFISVGADIGDFKKEMADMKKSMEKVGGDLKKVGGTLTKSVTAPIVGVGVAAFAAANDMDKAYKNIRAGTGATGKDLEALEKNFKNVFKEVPDDAEKVSNALADINTRTGLTGKPLEDMTKQFLQLSKVTGEDVSTSIADMTRLWGAWDIAAEDGADSMDFLWKTSQTFGIGVGELQSKLVDMGPTFQALGYSMEESAALLGHWEREGVNSGTMLAGLKKGMQNLAAAGKDPAKELPGIIESIKGMGDESDATALAMEYFGNKAGPEMAKAIREGKFEVEDLLGILDGSDETIGKAAEDTMSLGEQFQVLKNNTMVALEPIGKILLDLAKQFLPPLIEAVQRLAEWFANLSPQMQKTIMVIAAIAAAIGPLLVVAGTLISSLTALAPLFTAIKVVMLALTGPVGIVIAIVAALIAIGVLLYKNWSTIQEFATNIFTAIQNIITGALTAVKNIYNNIMAFLTERTTGAFGSVFSIIQNYLQLAATIITNIVNFWINTFKNAFAFLKALVTGDMQGMRNAIANQMQNIKNTFSNIFMGIVNFIRGLGSTFLNAGKGLIEQMLKGITGMAGKVVDKVKGIASSIRNLLPFSPAKEGPLSDLDQLDFGGPIEDSIGEGLPGVKAMMAELLELPPIDGDISGGIDDMGAAPGDLDDNGDLEDGATIYHEFGSIDINITGDGGQLDNEEIARAVEARLSQTLARDDRRIPSRTALGGI